MLLAGPARGLSRAAPLPVCWPPQCLPAPVPAPAVHTALLALRPIARRARPARAAAAARLGFMLFCSKCTKASGDRLDWIFVKQGVLLSFYHLGSISFIFLKI
jgi:hypothetical protein